MKTKTCIFAILLAGGLINGHAQDTWTQKADFGGTAREWAVGFSIGGKGYLGTGYDGNVSRIVRISGNTTLPANAWTQKADFGGTSKSGRGRIFHRQQRIYRY